MLTRIISIVFNNDNLLKYIQDIDNLKDDIIEIMDFPSEFFVLKYKYFIIYKLVLHEVI